MVLFSTQSSSLLLEMGEAVGGGGVKSENIGQT